MWYGMHGSRSVTVFCECGAADDRAMAKNPLTFIDEVRQEIRKVTWPTWKEVWITTIMVLIMVALTAIFFTIADQIIGWIVQTLLGLTR